MRPVNVLVGIMALLYGSFALVVEHGGEVAIAFGISFGCWLIDRLVWCRRPRQDDRNALMMLAGFTMFLAVVLGLSSPVASADPIGPNCQTDPWGFLGGQRRTVCDTVKNSAGEWQRKRTIWVPRHYVPFTCSSGRYFSSCSGGYWVDAYIVDQDEYPVTDATVLPDEPGCLGIGGRTV